MTDDRLAVWCAGEEWCPVTATATVIGKKWHPAIVHRLLAAEPLDLGIVYGVLTTLFLAVIVMPLWLSAVGFGGAPPFPNVSVPGTLFSTIGHVVYAIPVTVGYALVASD